MAGGFPKRETVPPAVAGRGIEVGRSARRVRFPTAVIISPERLCRQVSPSDGYATCNLNRCIAAFNKEAFTDETYPSDMPGRVCGVRACGDSGRAADRAG